MIARDPNVEQIEGETGWDIETDSGHVDLLTQLSVGAVHIWEQKNKRADTQSTSFSEQTNKYCR